MTCAQGASDGMGPKKEFFTLTLEGNLNDDPTKIEEEMRKKLEKELTDRNIRHGSLRISNGYTMANAPIVTIVVGAMGPNGYRSVKFDIKASRTWNPIIKRWGEHHGVKDPTNTATFIFLGYDLTMGDQKKIFPGSFISEYWDGCSTIQVMAQRNGPIYFRPFKKLTGEDNIHFTEMAATHTEDDWTEHNTDEIALLDSLRSKCFDITRSRERDKVLIERFVQSKEKTYRNLRLRYFIYWKRLRAFTCRASKAWRDDDSRPIFTRDIISVSENMYDIFQRTYMRTATTYFRLFKKVIVALPKDDAPPTPIGPMRPQRGFGRRRMIELWARAATVPDATVAMKSDLDDIKNFMKLSSNIDYSKNDSDDDSSEIAYSDLERDL